MAAVAISPSDLRAHRRLAAAFANSGDLAAAADEYARYITVARNRGDATRAQLEVEYALATLSVTPRALPTPTTPRPVAKPSRIVTRADRRPRRAMRFDMPMRSLITAILATIAISGVGPTPPRPMGHALRIARRADRRARLALRFALPVRSLIGTIFATVAISCLGAAIALGMSLVLGHR